jgi:hypothetical protein
MVKSVKTEEEEVEELLKCKTWIYHKQEDEEKFSANLVAGSRKEKYGVGNFVIHSFFI